MAIDLLRRTFESLPHLRVAATAKRLRARVGDDVVLDTTDAVLVWEPRRVVPEYAVPPGDLRLELTRTESTPPGDARGPFLEPGHFPWHTTPGTPFTATWQGRDLGEVAFAPDDPDLGGRIVLDFRAFDWTEEAEDVMGHPHDPFHRIDMLASDRPVRITVGDTVIAETDRAVALFETNLPTRWYVPVADVRMDLLQPSDLHTVCAYKGRANYLSYEGHKDLAWVYPDALPEAAPIRGMLSFWKDATVTVG